MRSVVLASIITAALVVSAVATVINLDSGDGGAEAGSDGSAQPSALLAGDWVTVFEILEGLEHGEFIGLTPEEFFFEVFVVGALGDDGAAQPLGNGGIAMSVESDEPAFVNVSGEAQVDGSFMLTGMGTVAGVDDVTVEFEGTIEFPGVLTGEYTMGAAGELPGTTAAVYGVTAEKVTQVTATPTATPESTATPTPAPSATPLPGIALRWADNDCDGDNDSVDALKGLQHVAAINFMQNEPCPGLGDSVSVAAGAEERLWGDVDCDGDIDAVDALKELRDIAAFDVSQEAGCPLIGAEVTVEI